MTRNLIGVLGLLGAVTFAQSAWSAMNSELSLGIVQRDSKILYISKTMSFSILIKDGAKSRSVTCRDSSSYIPDFGQDLLKGWDPAQALATTRVGLQSFSVADCRTNDLEILGWFPNATEDDYIVSEQLVRKDYKPAKQPLALRVRTAKGETQMYSCMKNFTRKKTGEGENYIEFTVNQACERISDVPASQTGMIDFITTPGPFAAIAGYRGWQLPWLERTEKNFEKSIDALLAQVPAGTYGGVMSTLSKTCDVKIERTPGKLTITHTINSSKRKRTVELVAANLLGAAEGPVFKDPIRVSASEMGRMAAAEFENKGKSLFVMFENRTDSDGQVARLNGSEAYCRRLVSK